MYKKSSVRSYTKQDVWMLLEEIATILLLSNVSSLVSAVSLCLEPGVNNRRRVGSEPRLLKKLFDTICFLSNKQVYETS